MAGTPGATLLHRAEQQPGAPFLVEDPGGPALTYAEVAALAGATAAALGPRVGRGDRVVLLAENSWRWVVAFFAVQMRGAAVVPANTRLGPGDLARAVADAEPTLVLGDPRHLGRLGGTGAPGTALDELIPAAAVRSGAPPEDLGRPDDVGVIAYTSGTTGDPKGVMLTMAAVVRSAELMGAVFHSHPGSRTVAMVPLFHNTGFVDAVLHMAVVGGCVEVRRRSDPAALLEGLASGRVSVFVGVPTMYTRMLDLAGDAVVPDAAPWLGYGGAGMTLPEIERLRRLFPAARPTNLYGLSEATSLTHHLPWLLGEGRWESVGVPVPGTQDRLADPGGSEIEIRSPTVMLGYWNRPEATADKLVDGWLRTGDLGSRDEAGMLHVVGRIDDLINRGGEKVAPFEVESALLRLPGVLECCVVGLPDRDLGEVVAVAYVPGPDPPGPAAIRAHLASTLADYKVPRVVVPVPRLPRNSHGKVARREVRDGLVAAGRR